MQLLESSKSHLALSNSELKGDIRNINDVTQISTYNPFSTKWQPPKLNDDTNWPGQETIRWECFPNK